MAFFKSTDFAFPSFDSTPLDVRPPPPQLDLAGILAAADGDGRRSQPNAAQQHSSALSGWLSGGGCGQGKDTWTGTAPPSTSAPSLLEVQRRAHAAPTPGSRGGAPAAKPSRRRPHEADLDESGESASPSDDMDLDKGVSECTNVRRRRLWQAGRDLIADVAHSDSTRRAPHTVLDDRHPVSTCPGTARARPALLSADAAALRSSVLARLWRRAPDGTLNCK